MARRRRKSRTAKGTGGGKSSPELPAAPASPPPRAPGRARRTLLPFAAILVLAPAIGLGLWALLSGRLPGSNGIDARPLNVVLVTADTLRADKLGCYGNHEIATPNLDRLAESGVVFENASSAAPVTLPSHVSILTGTYPLFHGVHENGAHALVPSRVTLAEALKGKGYRTGAFVGAFVLDSRFGLDQGFDRYGDDFPASAGESATRRPGEDVLDEALRWMDTVRDQRFFSWIHFFDPHAPYEPPEPYRSRYAADANGLYDGEVAHVDALMGRLLAWIDENGLADDTLVVFLADHGESLGEHGELTHGFFLYDATMRVPLILRAPFAAARGRRVGAQVRTIDVMPTVLDLVGVEPPKDVQGTSLVPWLTGGEEEELVAYGESTFPAHYGWSPLESLRTRERLFVAAPRPELYDVSRDPGAERNLASERAATVREMETRLDEIHDRYRSRDDVVDGTGTSAPIDEETRRKLTALGYFGAGPPHRREGAPALADPKDKIDVFNHIRAAAAAIDAARWPEAIEALEGVVRDDPDVVEAHTMLGRSYFSTGDWNRAADAYQRALALDPSYVTALFGLASTYQKMGRLDDAKAGLERVLDLEPRFAGASLLLARTEMGLGRHREALDLLEKMEASGDEAAAVWSLRAECRVALKDPDGALDAYRKAVELAPGDSLAHFNLAKLLGQKGRQDEMIAELEKSVAADPGFTVGHLYLANAYLDHGNPEKAVELARKGIALGPEPTLAPFGHFILADAYARLGRKQDAAKEMAIAQRLQSAIH